MSDMRASDGKEHQEVFAQSWGIEEGKAVREV
jgi:hypothetical protein